MTITGILIYTKHKLILIYVNIWNIFYIYVSTVYTIHTSVYLFFFED